MSRHRATRFIRTFTFACIALTLLPRMLSAAETPPDMHDWLPPTAADWTSPGDRLNEAWLKAKKQAPKVGGGVLWGPLVAVDRTDGTLYAFPQGGALWVSKDRGQSFEWLNHDILAWGFNESPTNLYVSPEGSKLRIFSSDHSGFSLDGGKTWKYMNFKLAFGFEDGHINWDGAGDSKTIVVRSHTWPSRMWISRDAGDSFAEFATDIMKQMNTQNMALLDDDCMLFQSEKLTRTEDYGKTLTEILPPTYTAPDGKKIPATFIGLSRRFKDTVYWLNSTGVFTSADKGKSWTLLGQNFPAEWIQKRLVRSGPLFGKDANHMLVLCLTHIGETLDGGKSWHVLAQLPVRLEDAPWAHSFAYDPIADVLYCNNRGHSGGPFLFGRLALKRWGDVEKTPPTDPADIQADLLPAGNGAKLHWKASTDASGIYTYRVYINDVLTYCTDQTELTLSDFAWNQDLKIAIQAVDAWQNRSAKVEKAVHLGSKPANAVLLRDQKPTTATFDDAPMEFLTDTYTAADKSTRPVTYQVDGYEPNPIPAYMRKTAANAVAVRVKPTFKQGVLEYNLDQKYTRLLLDTGMSDSAWDRVQLKIVVDGKPVSAIKPLNYETLLRKIGRKPESFDLDVTNAKTLRFEITVVNNRYWQEDVLVLANAMLITKSNGQ